MVSVLLDRKGKRDGAGSVLGGCGYGEVVGASDGADAAGSRGGGGFLSASGDGEEGKQN